MGLAFLITSDNLQLLSERKVLKQAEYAAMLDAAGVIEAAREEARHIEADALQHVRRERERARAEGLEQARTDQAAQLIDGARQSQQQLGALRDAMARLVTKAVAQLVAEADPAQVYAAALARVESLVREESFVNVRVAPAHEASLRRALANLRAAHGWMVEAAVQSDATLPDGTCVMQTASGTLALGIDAQLEAFERALRQHGTAPGAEEASP